MYYHIVIPHYLRFNTLKIFIIKKTPIYLESGFLLLSGLEFSSVKNFKIT